MDEKTIAGGSATFDGHDQKQTITNTIRNFGLETTLHGVRYIAAPSRFKSRKLAWIIVVITVIAIFSYAITDRLQYFFSYPTNIDLKEGYWPRVAFPAVTICNQNKYRLSAVQKAGFYDVLTESYKSLSVQPAENADPDLCEDVYVYHDGICTLPPDDHVVFMEHYHDTTAKVCQDLCTELEPERCFGIFYNVTHQICSLTSFTGGTMGEEDCEETRGLLYFRRNPCLKFNLVLCTLEDAVFKYEGRALCNIVRGGGQTLDSFDIITAANNPDRLDKDHSLQRGTGSYFYLLETNRRPMYDARLLVPFMDTTDKCLVFFYDIFGDNKGIISVVTINESLSRQEIFSKSTVSKTINKWRQVYLPLQDGIHQIEIKGTRASEGKSGMAIDDVMVRPCDHFELPCRVSRSGQEYKGNLSRDSTGATCLKWSSEDFDPASLYLNGVENACRNPDGNKNGPWCYVRDGQYRKVGYCDIPICPCVDDQFRCANGLCVSREKTCDGTNDCGDGSDEGTICDSDRSLACDFSDKFLCGYEQRGRNLYFYQDKSFAEYSMKLGRRSYMDPGDRVTFTSPFHNFGSNSTSVTFQTKMSTEEYDVLPKFKVFLKSESGIQKEPIMVVEKTWRPKYTTYDLTRGELRMSETEEISPAYARFLGKPAHTIFRRLLNGKEY